MAAFNPKIGHDHTQIGPAAVILDGHEASIALRRYVLAKAEIQLAGLTGIMGFPLVEALLHGKTIGWQMRGFNNVGNQNPHQSDAGGDDGEATKEHGGHPLLKMPHHAIIALNQS